MKWQAAHTIGTTFKFWVKVGPPMPGAWKEISKDGSGFSSQEPVNGRFYETNFVNPIDWRVSTLVKYDEIELEPEFADDVPMINHWWMNAKQD